MTNPPARGFTLMEVMITAAIVAILAAIALPSYRVYIERANRGVARATLSEVVSRQESHYLDRKRYTGSLSALGWGADTLYLDREGQLAASDSDRAIYRVTLQGNPGSTSCPPGGSADAGGYTVVAEPLGGQVRDTACATLCLSALDVKSASGSQRDSCWSR